MTFAAPIWLVLGSIAIALSLFGLRVADARRARDLEQFATENILPDLTRSLSPGRRRLKRSLLLGAMGLGFLALAGPEVGFDWEETERRGIDVLIAVDVSKSMLARDIRPNRLRRAKLAVDDLVSKLPGDRLGLIAFAGTAFLQCPLTLDHTAFDRSLSALTPGIISAPGSNLASALDVARKALASEARNVKLLILFSDGEDLRGGALSAAQRAAKDEINVFTVGVGTPAGELIPLPEEGDGAFVKDEEGRIVKSRLDEATLKKVAEVTDGFYVPLGPRAEGIDELVERALAPIPREELASRLRRIPRNQYQWPLVVALLLLLAEPFLGERRRETKVGALVILLLLGVTGPALAASPQTAAALYEDESYEAAAEEYRRLTEENDDPRLDLNLGAAAYRNGDFAAASSAFAEALRTENAPLRNQAFYSLGNAQYRVGEQTVESNPQQTIGAWEQAIAAYEEALSLDENDEDARFNRDFVKKKLEELQQEQEQQQNDDDQQDQEQDQEQNQEQDQEQDQDQNQDQEQDQEQDQNQEQDQDQNQEQNQEQNQDQEEQQDQQQDQDGEDQQDPEQSDPGKDPPAPGSPEESAPDDTPPEEQPAGGQEPPPGQLSPEEARDLLDSLQGDEEFMPMVPMAPTGDSDDPRDW